MSDHLEILLQLILLDAIGDQIQNESLVFRTIRYQLLQRLIEPLDPPWVLLLLVFKSAENSSLYFGLPHRELTMNLRSKFTHA
jgi:hypothetical protein